MSATSMGSYVTIFGRRVHKAWLILIGCCILQSSTLAPIMGCAGNFFVPICEELNCGRSEISAYMTAYWLAMIPSLPVAGKIMAQHDTRFVISVSIAAVALAVACMSFYTQPWMWIVSGIIFGTFGCCVFTIPLVSMITAWFHKHAGIAMGIATASSALAIVVLSPVLEYCISSFGWRNAYLIEAAVVVVFALPCGLFLLHGEPKDWGAVPYGIDDAEDARLKEETGLDFKNKPGVPLRKALRSVPFWMLFIFAGVAAMIGSGFDSHLPGFAQSLGFSAQYGAFMVSALAFGSFCEKLVMGWVNDKFDVWVGVSVEFALVSAGVVGLLCLRDPKLVLLATFVFGVQDSFSNVSLPLLVRKIFGQRDYTEIFSWVRMGAGIFGSSAAVLVGLSYDLTGSYYPAFIATFGLVALGALCVFIAAQTRKSLPWSTSDTAKEVFMNRR